MELVPPPGVTPVYWLLLTALPLTAYAAAVQDVPWYTLRWLIER